MRNRKILKTFQNHREKMSVRVNVRMSKITLTPIQVSIRLYVTYVNCRTLKCYLLTFISFLIC